MSIWVQGLSGSGKTTLVKHLADILHCDILVIGEILRAVYPPRRILNTDIPQSEIFGIVSDRMSRASTNTIIVDNYPINNDQLKNWESCYALPFVIFLLETKDANKRKIDRGRIDDADQKLAQKRKLQFEEETLPMIECLGKRVFVSKLDANKTPMVLVQEALTIIRNSFTNFRTNLCDQTVLKVECQSLFAKVPKRSSPFSGGIDIFLTRPTVIPAYKTERHSIFISLGVTARTVGTILPKSSVAERGILVHSGVINPFCSDSLGVVITNLNSEPILIDDHTAVAQLLILPVFCPQIIESQTVKSSV